MSNTKKKKWIGLTAGLLAAVLTVAAPAEQMHSLVFAAQQETEQMREGGVIGFVTEPVERVLPKDDMGAGTAGLRSITPSLRQYEWDSYSNDYYYSQLTAKEQLLYERLDAACGALLSSPTADAETYEVRREGILVQRRGTKMISTSGLTETQVKRVLGVFAYANPQYYFLNLSFLTMDNACALGIYDAFAEGSARVAATQAVFARLEALQAQISDTDIVYERERQIHDLICEEVVYLTGTDVLADASDPYYTQTIYGALINGETVCAGYAKLYAALCNYFGIDCISVQSNDHGWNQVRYGDHWYIVDVTWDDDSSDPYRFFHITDQQMLAMDQANSHVVNELLADIRPAADTPFSNELMTMPGLEQPQVEIKDTSAGVTITMASEEGAVYYTLDGTIPDTDDLYMEPVELTERGTYVVTAVADRDGKIASAYEVFSVRIAGGSVSIATAVNTASRKIKVSYKTSTTYTGYEVSYASKKDFSNQKSAKVKSKAVTISGLKKGKTYYIRVRGYKKDAYGNFYYTPYSKVKKVTIKK